MNVQELTVEDFKALVAETVTAVLEEEGKSFPARLVGRMTVEEFAQFYVKMAETKQLMHAQTEYETAKKVFKDTQLLAAATPFRVTSPDKALEIGQELARLTKEFPTKSIVVSYAIVE